MDQDSMEDHNRLWLWHDEDHSHHVLSTAKMVTTFASGIAAAFVAAGLQEGPPNGWDTAAAILLGLTFALTFFVLVVRKKGIPIDDAQNKSFADLHAQHLETAKANGAALRSCTASCSCRWALPRSPASSPCTHCSPVSAWR